MAAVFVIFTGDRLPYDRAVILAFARRDRIIVCGGHCVPRQITSASGKVTSMGIEGQLKQTGVVLQVKAPDTAVLPVSMRTRS